MFYIDIRKAKDFGIGEYIRNVVPGVCERLKDDSCKEITLICHANQDISFVGNIVGLRAVEMASSPFSLNEQLEFCKLISRDDYFWATSLSHPIIKSCRTFATIHDVAQLDLPTTSYNGPLHKAIFWAYFKSLHRKSACLVFNSKFTRDRFRYYFPENLVPEAITHLGVKESLATYVDLAGVRKENFFIAIGNSRPHKNLPFLINSFLLNKNLSDFRLKVIGCSGNFSPSVGKSMAESTRVEFLGYIPESELKNQICRAQALFFPSLYEGFGLPAIEAMSLGCPVIASNTSALPEVCGDAAIYFDPLDRHSFNSAIDAFFLAIRKTNPVELSSRFRLQASRFSWLNCINETASLFEETLNCQKS